MPSAGNKVAINTAILYGRMMITMGITLYSTRLVLNGLGNVDFGIYNLIAGVIAMLSFLNTAMATSTQRYLSFYKGKNDMVMQRKVFTNSLVLHILIGFVLVAVLELMSLFIFHGFLNIPANRIESAKIIYHLMSATVFFTIIAVPFIGALTANENMLWIAFINIIETVFKLGVAILLFYMVNNKLVTYGVLIECISMCSFFLYSIYCFKKYTECSFKKFWVVENSLLKELGSFAGWNLFGSLCAVGRSQGLAILLNIFLGTVVNAAYGIANQVSAQLNFFSVTMLRALNPQIMKSEGADDRKRMLKLSMIASKFGFFLVAIFAIPCIFEMHNLLALWLKNVPEYTVVFCCLILMGTMINQLTIGLQSGLQATGKVKTYQAVVGTVLLFNLPVAYFLLKANFPPYSVLVSYIFFEASACFLRLIFIKKIAGLSIREYFLRVILREVIPVGMAVLCCFLITTYVHIKLRFFLTGSVSSVFFIISIYFAGLYTDEKTMVSNLFKSIKSKLLVEKLKYVSPKSKVSI